MSRELTLNDRLKAKELKRKIRELETEQRMIAARFARYDRCSVEEQLATQTRFHRQPTKDRSTESGAAQARMHLMAKAEGHLMPDDIAHWKRERHKLQEQLDGLESSVIEPESLPLIQYLRTRIGDIDRHLASLERRRL
jgi:hypothetical protein